MTAASPAAATSTLERLETQKQLYARALRDTSQELEAKIEELGLVRRLGTLFEQADRLEEVAAHSLPLFLESSRAANTSILLYSGATGELNLLAAAGRDQGRVGYYGPEGYARRVLPRDEGLAYACLADEVAVLAEDVGREPRFVATDSPLELGSIVCLPLKVHGQLLGVLNLSHPAPGGLDPRRLPLWIILASHLAAALAHAQLVTRLKGANRSLSRRVQARTASLERANQELQEARDQVRAQNSDLQMRVQERTRELETALEELQAQHRELAEANRVKDEFLNNINHELKTPLNAVIGYAGLLLKGTSGAITDAQRSDLELIEANGRHLQQVLENIFSLQDIEDGAVEPVLEPCDLNELVAEAVASVRPRGVEKGLEVEFCPLDVPPLRLDPTLLRRVLFNLLDNAVKFSTRGTVRVSTRAAVRRPEQPQQELDEGETGTLFAIVEVADQGKGIDPGELQNIFRKFHQVEAPTRKSTGGSGVGLTIAKNLVELHGGRVWVTSRPGSGSTFAFCLPTSPPAR
ncbi:MAG: GAF domain-containing sensor histidine kinase [Deferrisomatales bacterium]|nr:GAF domain-containing sensor histidine kinase [Deferrisomatales bacterium]